MTEGDKDDLAIRRQNSPITKARCIAFRLLTKHPDCLKDDTVLDDLLEDIAQAILAGLTNGEEVDKP